MPKDKQGRRRGGTYVGLSVTVTKEAKRKLAKTTKTHFVNQSAAVEEALEMLFKRFGT